MCRAVLALFIYKIMKIAVPTREGVVDNHFGHCDHYTIFTIEGDKIVEQMNLPSPQGCGCKSGIAADLQAAGVQVMLAGSMGMGALNKLAAHDIKVVRGCSGDVVALVNAYLAGEVDDSGVSCAAHEDGHECAGHSHAVANGVVGYAAKIKKT